MAGAYTELSIEPYDPLRLQGPNAGYPCKPKQDYHGNFWMVVEQEIERVSHTYLLRAKRNPTDGSITWEVAEIPTIDDLPVYPLQITVDKNDNVYLGIGGLGYGVLKASIISEGPLTMSWSYGIYQLEPETFTYGITLNPEHTEGGILCYDGSADYFMVEFSTATLWITNVAHLEHEAGYEVIPYLETDTTLSINFRTTYYVEYSTSGNFNDIIIRSYYLDDPLAAQQHYHYENPDGYDIQWVADFNINSAGALALLWEGEIPPEEFEILWYTMNEINPA